MKSNVIFYSNKADKRVVNKSSYITRYDTLRGNFKDEVNLLNPTFIVESKEVPTCNYCYIEDFRRYYYINDIKVIRNNIYSISCSVDVLMSYKQYITNSTQYVSRQENTYNELLVDDKVSFNDDYEFTIYQQNIEELEYGKVDDTTTSSPSEKVNIICTWYQTKL